MISKPSQWHNGTAFCAEASSIIGAAAEFGDGVSVRIILATVRESFNRGRVLRAGCTGIAILIGLYAQARRANAPALRLGSLADKLV